MNELMIGVLSVVGLVAGFFISYFIGSKQTAVKIEAAKLNAQNIIQEAEKEAKNIKKEKLLEVKEEWHRKKQEFENETQARKAKIQTREKQIKAREDAVESKADATGKKEKHLQALEQELQKKEKSLKEKTEKVDTLIETHVQQLEQISGISRDEAKRQLYENFVNDAKSEAAQIIKQIKDDTKSKATKEAQNIVVQAIQRSASDHSVESTVSVVNLDSDEMKGRIIGREGRNIRAFEAATGIDLIIDDTPEAVVISGFDPFRREVAKLALERLMVDGRIHPARIEEIVEKTQKELEEEIVRIGDNALLELNIHNVHNELIRYVGKMRYRSSYGQNLLNHSIEVSYLCGIMAAELGLDTNMAKRAGLLHDIGKCVDKNTEGPHALLGMELAKKFREHNIICNAIGAHHEDIEMESPIAVLVQAADSISGARPGARQLGRASCRERV